jgi:hypothetical protein
MYIIVENTNTNTGKVERKIIPNLSKLFKRISCLNTSKYEVRIKYLRIHGA